MSAVQLDALVVEAVTTDTRRALADLARRVTDVGAVSWPGLPAALRWRLDDLLERLDHHLDRLSALLGAVAELARRVVALDRASVQASLVAAPTRTTARAVSTPGAAMLALRDAGRRRWATAQRAAWSRMAARPWLGEPGNDVVGRGRRHELARRVALVDAVLGTDLVLDLDLRGDGRAVVALGDPTTAPHVATLVPGIGTTVHDLSGLLDQARALREQSMALQADDVAVVVWLGHDAPPGPFEIAAGLLRGDHAPVLRAVAPGPVRAIGRDLADLAARLRGANPGMHHTLVGHSHGATIALSAAHVDDAGVDEVVMLGAPGTGPTRPTRDLGHAPGWWSAVAPWDPVPFLPVLGPRPRRRGAVPLDVGPGNVGHGAYLAPATAGLAAVALVVVGRDGCPVPRDRRPRRVSRSW